MLDNKLKNEDEVIAWLIASSTINVIFFANVFQYTWFILEHPDLKRFLQKMLLSYAKNFLKLARILGGMFIIQVKTLFLKDLGIIEEKEKEGENGQEEA